MVRERVHKEGKTQVLCTTNAMSEGENGASELIWDEGRDGSFRSR